ncbi:MAG: hypothetical protein LBR98_07680 [Syntrophomonadaceae bacterium]|nr:hypothetical protein [Syntrophomonadaceae bacterium]
MSTFIPHSLPLSYYLPKGGMASGVPCQGGLRKSGACPEENRKSTAPDFQQYVSRITQEVL